MSVWQGKAIATLRRVAHALRLTAAGLLAGMVAGATAGLGSRLAMFVVRLMNPSYNGVITHASAEVGRITADGTLSLAIEGVFYGLPGAALYLIVRRWMPWDGFPKGLAYGCFLLVIAGPIVLDGNYEFFRYVSTRVSVGLFALLYPLYGLVLAPLTERLGQGTKGPPRNAVVAWSGYLILGGVAAWSLIRDVVRLRDVFHVFG
ncbi:MAG TPA: hypothetical protein VG452_10525 [Egibacteraceae bacterium]|nr:hypothetical protein [Actinomycetota bacterium]HWB72643.1 hypothetical protein [Egibacteraceae bacterium]